MLNRQLGTLFLYTCLILTTVPAVLGGRNKQVVTFAGDVKHHLASLNNESPVLTIETFRVAFQAAIA
jgi:hypothetical protein